MKPPVPEDPPTLLMKFLHQVGRSGRLTSVQRPKTTICTLYLVDKCSSGSSKFSIALIITPDSQKAPERGKECLQV